MPFSIAEHFAKNHGGDKELEKLVEMVYEDDGNDALKAIAEHFKVSKSQACRLRKSLFRRRWVPVRGLVEYLEFKKHCLEREVQRREEFIKEKSNLKLVVGGLHHESPNH